MTTSETTMLKCHPKLSGKFLILPVNYNIINVFPRYFFIFILFLLNVHLIFRTVPFFSQEPGPEVIKLLSCSTQQEISLGHKNKNTNN